MIDLKLYTKLSTSSFLGLNHLSLALDKQNISSRIIHGCKESLNVDGIVQHVKEQNFNNAGISAYPHKVQNLTLNLPTLSVVITVVSGRKSLRQCLKMLVPQTETTNTEIIVPYDTYSADIAELDSEFPDVRFHRISESVPNSSFKVAHRLYDRRRAVGLALARGSIIALTEDHATPAHDWCECIIKAHHCSADAIGGAIENGVDRLLNWAWYYCDFGRYGRPFPKGRINYASDVNISYKREALELIRDIWQDTFQETTVNWELQKRGRTITLDPRPVVYEHRPLMPFHRALRERYEWARIFAETRIHRIGRNERLLYVLSTPLLPTLLSARALKHMLRHRRSISQLVTIIPVVLCMEVGWSLGELVVYLFGDAAPKGGAVGARSDTTYVGQKIKLVTEITQEQKKQTEEIISGMECPKDFACYKSGFKNLSKIQNFLNGALVRCLEESLHSCKFYSTFCSFHFCKCPLRKYIVRNFNR